MMPYLKDKQNLKNFRGKVELVFKFLSESFVLCKYWLCTAFMGNFNAIFISIFIQL